MVFTTRVPEIFVFLYHLIYHLILIKHFRVVLLFNLDVSQEFSKTGLAEVKDVGIVLAGDQLFRSNAVWESVKGRSVLFQRKRFGRKQDRKSVV